jgi:V8-like Glu-specific endopeptidase
MSNTTPMTSDDLVRLDNTMDGDEPADLTEMRHRAPMYISSLKGEARSNAKLIRSPEYSKMASADVWEFDLGQEFAVGQIGGKAKALSRPKDVGQKKKDVVPHVPKWSGIEYHPKLSAPRPLRPFRRANRNRVEPHGYIFGPDDRQVYYPSGYPWRCIGVVQAWTNPSNPSPAWYGVGALVGSNVVLTCSHVCPWGASPWMMRFIPAYYDGASLLGSGVASYVQSYRGYRDHGQGDDMAVLKLYTPLGNSIGWFGSKTYDDDWEDGNYWTKCGYPSAIASGQRPSRITWFPIIDDDSDGAGLELEYRADASGGDSGGPVFGWWSSLPYIIGTHSGGEKEYHFPFSIVKNNVAAGGGALPRLIIWAHNNW